MHHRPIKRISGVCLLVLLLASAVAYYHVYTSSVLRYRGLIYQSTQKAHETIYTASDGIISLSESKHMDTVTITYQWNAPKTFVVQQLGDRTTVQTQEGTPLLDGFWRGNQLLHTDGEPDETYTRLKNAWIDNQKASVQRPTPPNAAEALDIARGVLITRRGKGIAPKILPLSILVIIVLLLSERAKADASERWGKVFKKNLSNPAVQVLLQADETGAPIRDAIFSKYWLVCLLYAVFLLLVLLYDIS